MSKKYQTLSDFMFSPFHRTDSMDKNIKYEKMYEEMNMKKQIYIEGYTVIEDSYYIHVKVPSESKKSDKYEYDVVIRFFTDKPSVKMSISLRDYYIQFFSNSPGFIYKYAALYRKEGYLIEVLQDKLDPEYKDVMPEKTNSDMILSYDKSIYFACKYLSEAKFKVLNKGGILLQKKKSLSKFLADISDFKSVKYDQELLSVEKQLKKSLGTDKGVREHARTQLDIHRKLAGKSTSKDLQSIVSKNKKISKKTGNKKISKKVASMSTFKKK